MDHETAKSALDATTGETSTALVTCRQGSTKRGLVPQWLVVLTILLVASVVLERTKTPSSPVSASRITVESWRFNRT